MVVNQEYHIQTKRKVTKEDRIKKLIRHPENIDNPENIVNPEHFVLLIEIFRYRPTEKDTDLDSASQRTLINKKKLFWTF